MKVEKCKNCGAELGHHGPMALMVSVDLDLRHDNKQYGKLFIACNSCGDKIYSDMSFFGVSGDTAYGKTKRVRKSRSVSGKSKG